METRIKFSQNGATPFAKLLGHNVDVLKSWNKLEAAFSNRTSLESDLLEQVRRTLAFKNRCKYCMAKGEPNATKKDNREAYATAFAALFADNHLAVGDQDFQKLREVFTEVEIAELCSFISFISASQRLGAIYNLTPESKTA